jgi:beta-glucosidase
VDGLTVQVDVTNTGSVAGKEAVQVYVHDHKSGLVRPPKELKGLAKIELQTGETKTVTLQLDSRAFAYYHPAFKQWITESGEFDILIGASSADIRCTQTVTLQSTLELPCILNRESTLREWLDDPHGKPVFEPLFKMLVAQIAALLGGGEGDAGAMGMDPMGMMMDMPLRDILHFRESALPVPADEFIDGLLAQARGDTE